MALDDDEPSLGEAEKGTPHPNFRVFTNPLEMERFFNQQMDEILKTFGFFGSAGSNGPRENNDNTFPAFPSFPSTIPSGQFGHGSTNQEDEIEKGSRDYMLKEDSEKQKLKPGYVEPDADVSGFPKKGQQTKRRDLDLDDGGMTSAELDELFKKPQEKYGATTPNSATPNDDWFGNRGGGWFGRGGVFGNSDTFPFPRPFQEQQVNT